MVILIYIDFIFFGFVGIYLTNDELKVNLEKMRDNLNENGFILYKDNISINKEYFL